MARPAIGQRLGILLTAKPLRGEARLDDVFAAVAAAYRELVIVDGAEEALRFEVGDDALAGFVAVEACVGRAASDVDVRGLVHDVDGRQVVALAEGEVVGVVRGVT
jgi:hypothetical protein